jgi:hypothetical protein
VKKKHHSASLKIHWALSRHHQSIVKGSSRDRQGIIKGSSRDRQGIIKVSSIVPKQEKMHLQFSLLGSFLFLAPLALAADCTGAQLRGTNGNLFRLTGGGGTYSSGSHQVVSYDRPAGSLVSAITGLTIVPVYSDSPVYAIFSLNGIPVNFGSGAADLAGSVNVQLPLDLPEGSFRFRMQVSSSSSSCTVHSIPFTSLGDDGSSNQCSLGESRCNNLASFVSCIATSGGNIFGGDVNLCSAGTSCVQAGNRAICSSGSGTPTGCVLGSFRCSGDTGFEQCSFNANGNAVFGPLRQCAEGTHCVQNLGSITCGATPLDQCTLGQRQCTSISTFRVCVQGPQGNLIYGSLQQCSAGTSCTGSGLCTAGQGTMCTLGDMRCVTSDTWQQCAYTSIGGTAFGPAQLCAPGTSCESYLDDYILCK